MAAITHRSFSIMHAFHLISRWIFDLKTQINQCQLREIDTGAITNIVTPKYWTSAEEIDQKTASENSNCATQVEERRISIRFKRYKKDSKHRIYAYHAYPKKESEHSFTLDKVYFI